MNAKCESCRHGCKGTKQQKITQILARREKSDRERHGGGSKQGCACDNSDLKRTEAQLG